jgi:ATPase subunit of ABC transporter with duplicated ATPase domains
LDTQGIDRLTEFILTCDKTCLVISHDESFLNTFTDSVLYLDSFTRQVEGYDGNYDDVKREIAIRIQKENQANARLAKQAQEKKDQSNKFKDKGGGLRKVAKRMREDAEKMEAMQVEVRKEDKALKSFTIPCQHGVGGELIDLSAVSLPLPASSRGAADTGQLAVMPLQVPVSLKKGMRLHLKGPNGIGKTTLLENIVKGRITGCTIPSGIEVGYYRQDFSTLNMDHTILESFTEVCPNATEEHLRKTAAAFQLTGPMVYQKISSLSEGQKGLCAFARLVLQEPALLIMDEPTNHINFRHLPALAEALNEFPGALIVVSHDHSFVEKIKMDHTMDLGDERDRFLRMAKLAAQKTKTTTATATTVSIGARAGVGVGVVKMTVPAAAAEQQQEEEEGEVLHAQLIASLASLRLERAKLSTRAPIQKVSVRSLGPDGNFRKKITPNLFA